MLPGETVTWDGQGSLMHSVHFEGEVDPVAAPSSNFSGSRQFDDPGVFRYYCDVHGFMRGTVHVNATGTVPTPDPTASPTASPTPTATATPPPPTTGGPQPGTATPTVTSFRARATKGRFCTRRSARCKRPGVFLTLDLAASEAVRVRGTLRRGSRRVRTVTLAGRPGRHRRAAARPGAEGGPLRAHAARRRTCRAWCASACAAPSPFTIAAAARLRRVAQQLWLLRHGEAVPHDSKPDPERELTARGERQSAAAGAALARLGVEFDAIYTSPKVRAAGTAKLAAEALNVEPEEEAVLADGFERSDAIELLDRHGADARVLVVGHDPSFTQVVYDLTGGRVDFKKGAVVAVRVRGSEAELMLMLRPRELESLALTD